MRLLPLLLTSVLMLSGAAYAADQQLLNQSDKLKEGLAALRSGDKAKAWDVMFPLAQTGDVQSMYYLGEMMLRSPEYGDNLERALKFFTVAAAKGHAGAKHQLERVKALVEQKATNALPGIAGMNGIPTEADFAKANAALAKYKAEVLRYTDNLIDVPEIPRVEVMVFLAKTDATAETLYRMVQGLENQFGSKIKTRFFVVINPADWKPDGPPIGGSNLPPNGFTPDFKGHLAAQHGVSRLPSVVVLPPSGQVKVVDDLTSLSSLISSLL